MKRNLAFSIILCGLCLFWGNSQTSAATLKPKVPRSEVEGGLVFSDSFEQEVPLESPSGEMGIWSRLQNEASLSSFNLSSDRAHTGVKSLKIHHDGKSWGSVITRTLQAETQGELSLYMHDDGAQPTGYVYLGATEIDPINNPKLGKQGGISLGIYPSVSKDFYVYCPTQDLKGCMSTKIKRTPGWHKLTIRVTPLGALGLIDENNLAVLPANSVTRALNSSLTTFGRINIGINTTSDTNDYYFDDLSLSALAATPNINALSMSFINQYLSIYGSIDVKTIDDMIKDRLDDFCPLDYEWDGSDGPKCPIDGSERRPLWHYKEQLFHVYDSLLITAGAHGLMYEKTGSEVNLQKAKEIIKYVDGQYSNWRQREEECQLLEKHCVTGSIVGLILGHVSWLVWDDLDVEQQISITKHLMQEGAFYHKHLRPFTGHIGNSGGEENSWMASYLDRLSLIFRQRYETAPWYEKAKLLAFHALSTGEEEGGITTQTIYPDYLFDNHNFHPHPTYGTTTAFSLASLDFLRREITGVITPEYTHNVLNVWNKMAEYIDFRDFQYKGNKISRVQAPKPDRINKKTQQKGSSVYNSGINDLFSSRHIPTSPFQYSPLGVTIGAAPEQAVEVGGFGATGKNDWGADAAGLTQYNIMKDMFGINTLSDPETGFSTPNLLQHAIEYMYYVRSGVLWKPEKANVMFTEMLIDEPTEDRNDRASYKWYENSSFVWEFISHFYYYDNVVKFKSTNICEDNLYKKREWTGTFKWDCDGTTAFKGTKSLKMMFEGPADGEVYSSLIQVEPNTAYTLSYVSKSKDLKKETSEILGRLIPAQYTVKTVEDDQVNENRIDPGFQYGQDTEENQNWKKVTIEFTTQPETAFVRLRAIIGKGTGTGTVWFDDVSLIKKEYTYEFDKNRDGKVDGVDYVAWFNEHTEGRRAGQREDYQKWLRDYLLQ